VHDTTPVGWKLSANQVSYFTTLPVIRMLWGGILQIFSINAAHLPLDSVAGKLIAVVQRDLISNVQMQQQFGCHLTQPAKRITPYFYLLHLSQLRNSGYMKFPQKVGKKEHPRLHAIVLLAL